MESISEGNISTAVNREGQYEGNVSTAVNREGQYEAASSLQNLPVYTRLNHMNGHEQTHLKQRDGEQTHVKQLDSDQTHVKQLDSDQTHVKQLDSDKTHVKQLDSDQTHVKQLDSDQTHVEQYDEEGQYEGNISTAVYREGQYEAASSLQNLPVYTRLNHMNGQEQTHVKQHDSEQTHVKQCDSEQTHVKQHDSDQTHMKQCDSEQTYVKQLDSDQTYVKQLNSEQTHVKQCDNEQTHVKQLNSEQTHVKQLDSDQTHVKQLDSDQTHVKQPHSLQNSVCKSAQNIYVTNTEHLPSRIFLNKLGSEDWDGCSTNLDSVGTVSFGRDTNNAFTVATYASNHQATSQQGACNPRTPSSSEEYAEISTDEAMYDDIAESSYKDIGDQERNTGTTLGSLQQSMTPSPRKEVVQSYSMTPKQRKKVLWTVMPVISILITGLLSAFVVYIVKYTKETSQTSSLMVSTVTPQQSSPTEHETSRTSPSLMVSTVTPQQSSPTEHVRLPPTITNQNEDPVHYKLLGDEVELYCEADGHPAPDYEWKKDGQILDINTTSVEPILGGILLKDLGYEHQGEYQCFASNPFGTTMTNLNSVILSVISGYPPNEPTEVYMVDEGKPFKMICKSVKSIPMEKMRQDWATVIDRDSSEYTDIILDRRVQQDDLGNLVFSYVTKNDEKDGYLYRCQVTNAVAAISTFGSWSTITVNEVDPLVNFVQPKIQFNTGETTEDTVVALKREQISLRCLFSGKPAPEVSWSRVGGDIDLDRMKISQLNTVLTISDVRDSDEGQYQCTGTNQQKRISDSKIITVNVEAKPFFEDPATKPWNTNKTDGEDVRLRCDPDAEPPAEITWMMNGDILEGETIPPRVSITENGRTLLIKDVCKKCWGNKTDLKVYQCLAENKHGSVFVSSYLNILSATELTEHHEDVDLVYNKLVEFKCDGQSDVSTPIKLSWLLDNQRIDYIEDWIWPEEEGRVLKLQTKNLGEEVLNYVGNYTCIVSNGYSQANWTAALIMPTEVPPIVQETGIGVFWWIFVVTGVALLLMLLLLLCCFCPSDRWRCGESNV